MCFIRYAGSRCCWGQNTWIWRWNIGMSNVIISVRKRIISYTGKNLKLKIENVEYKCYFSLIIVHLLVCLSICLFVCLFVSLLLPCSLSQYPNRFFSSCLIRCIRQSSRSIIKYLQTLDNLKQFKIYALW